jgi:DNA gyrase subunit A
VFTENGQCATIPVGQIPQVNDPSAGAHFSTLSSLAENEVPTAVLSLPNNAVEGYLFFATENGEVKRIRLDDLPGLTANVFTVMDIEDGDRLGWVFPTTGDDEVMLVSTQAQAIRFKESDVRPTGLPAGGMRGIKLAEEDDKVIGAVIATAHSGENGSDGGKFVWTITEDGVAKSSPLDEYPSQGRAGSGVITMKLPPNSGGLAAATIGGLNDTILILSSKYRAWQMKLGKTPQAKRAAKGDYIVSVAGKERVDAVIMHQQKYSPPMNGYSEETDNDAVDGE